MRCIQYGWTLTTPNGIVQNHGSIRDGVHYRLQIIGRQYRTSRNAYDGWFVINADLAGSENGVVQTASVGNDEAVGVAEYAREAEWGLL